MIMTVVIVIMIGISLIFAMVTGSISQVAQATVSGAKDGVELILSIGGTVCLWSGLLEVMNRSGLAGKISKLLRPVIRLLFGKYAEDEQACSYIGQNMASNLLGLGSAATPSGLKAAKRLMQLSKEKGEVPHSVFLLIIINTASIQLLPTTIAAVRASEGCTTPYDIIPAVWLASAVSVCFGITAAKLMRGRK